MTILVLIMIGVIALVVMTARQSWRAHKERYGTLPVIFRWLSGRQRHGLEGNDRRHDDRYDPMSSHYHPGERWSRGIQRTSLVFCLPFLLLFYITGKPADALYGFSLLGVAAINKVGRMTIRGKLNWRHAGRAVVRKPSLIRNTRVEYVRKPASSQTKALHRKLVPVVGMPTTVKPGQWIRAVGSKGVEIDLPRNWNGSEAERNKIVSTTKETMGMHPDAYVKWNLGHNERSSVTIRDQASTPPHVTLKDVELDIEKAGSDRIVFGLGRGNEPVSASLKTDAPHFGLSIAPGGGKSQIARLMASQVLHNGGIVLFLDIKRLSHAWARDLPNIRYARTPDEIHEALLWLRREIIRRIKVADAGSDVEGDVLANVGPRLLVVCEELNQTMAELRSLWADVRTRKQPKKSPAISALEGALFMGRQLNVNMLAVAQMMTALAAGSGAARESMGIRILGRYTKNNWKMLVPEWDMPPRTLHPGHVQVVTSKVQECQIAFLSGAEARAFATDGIVTGWPVEEPEEVEPQDRIVVTSTIVSEIDDLEDEEVTLQEAIANGYTRRNIKALYNARTRDRKFPPSIGQHKDRHGAPRTYSAKAIAKWDQDAGLP